MAQQERPLLLPQPVPWIIFDQKKEHRHQPWWLTPKSDPGAGIRHLGPVTVRLAH